MSMPAVKARPAPRHEVPEWVEVPDQAEGDPRPARDGTGAAEVRGGGRSPKLRAPARSGGPPESDPDTAASGDDDTAAGDRLPFGGGLPARNRLRGLLRRADPGQGGARALVAVCLVAALLAGGFLWASRPRPQPVSTTETRQVTSPPDHDRPQPSTVVVHVAGKVRRPGIVTLAAGARVAQAIQAAGGLRAGAGVDGLNLARPVVDGEQILVGVRPATPPQGAPGPVASPPAGPASAGTDSRIDLNTATIEQFQELPGVGPVLAQRIIDHRARTGGFRSVDQLQDVTGIGARRYAELKDRVRV